ncbi:MAG TPA: MBOAT family O-acyltransferase, partial [Methanotrichaceae archaeon]|nr:MBOAT family O-acyltransferase [Methanotrichaceae archaeon]
APLGISYFTFMALGYVIDIYRGKLEPTGSLLEYALFVGFFPVISSGPIIRARDFFSQFVARLKINSEDMQHGLALISTGLIMKLVIADNLANYVDPRFASITDFGSRTIILATLAFGVQLYCDFGGYSNIALGSARLLGFKFPMNFNNPYFAMSPTDFWHRWNISLSTWLRDYLYIPLGGNRKGPLKTHLNLIITMVACGLWHGASWNFLIWGAYHGGLLSLNRLIRLPENRLLSFAGMLLTQYLVFFGWLIFKVNDPSKLAYCMSKFLMPTGLSYSEIGLGILAASALILVSGRVANNDWISRLGTVRPAYWFVYLVMAIMLIYWGSPVKMTKFIYAGF